MENGQYLLTVLTKKRGTCHASNSLTGTCTMWSIDSLNTEHFFTIINIFQLKLDVQ